MKIKLIAIAVICTLLMNANSLGVYAATDTYIAEDGSVYTYGVSVDSVKIYYVEPASRSISVPSHIEGLPVTVIGCNEGFLKGDNSGIVSEIILPDTVVRIADESFYNSNFRDVHLEHIKLSKNLQSIGDYAFSKCYGLTDIEFPDSLKYIGNRAFSGCVSLNSLTLPDSVVCIGKYAFSGCSNLRNVRLSNSMVEIPEGAFSNCANLYILDMGNSVTKIGWGAFSDCYNLTGLYLSNSLEVIGEEAFSKCYTIWSIYFPDSLKTIERAAFSNC